jgi:hypothetical protein
LIKIFKMSRLHIILVSFLLIAGAYAGLRGWTGTKQEVRSFESTVTGSTVAELMDSMYIQQLTGEKKAPDFLLSALEGDQSRLSQYQGNVVLISFWATL